MLERPPPLRQLIEDRLGEPLTPWLAARVAEGTSARETAAMLAQLTGMYVSAQTVGTWRAEAVTA